MQRHIKISQSSQRMHESVFDIRTALADGWQPSDFAVIVAACEDLTGQLAVIEDVEMDLIAAKRVLTVGRAGVYDERFAARERDLRGVLRRERERFSWRIRFRPRKEGKAKASTGEVEAYVSNKSA